MDRSRSGNALFISLLIVVCLFAAIFSFSLFRQIKIAENNSNKEKESLRGEAASLKSEADSLKNEAVSLKNELNAKADMISALQAEAKNIAERENALKAMTETLKKDTDKYKGESSMLNSYTPSQLILLILSREKDEKVKRLLENTVERLNMIKRGGVIELEPIVVTKTSRSRNPVLYGQKQAKILFLDRKNGFFIIDLGALHNVKDGQSCTIYDGKTGICTATVVWTGNTMSAIRTIDFQPGRSVKDVMDGLRVILD